MASQGQQGRTRTVTTRQLLAEAEHLRPCHRLKQVHERCSDAHHGVSSRAPRPDNAAHHLHHMWLSSSSNALRTRQVPRKPRTRAAGAAPQRWRWRMGRRARAKDGALARHPQTCGRLPAAPCCSGAAQASAPPPASYTLIYGKGPYNRAVVNPAAGCMRVRGTA